MKHLLPFLMAAMAAVPAMAQTVIPAQNPDAENVGVPERAVILSGGANGIHRDVMAVLYDTSELDFHDAKVPRYLLIDRKGTTVFGIGGYIEGVAQYDMDGAIESNGFTTALIDVPNNPAQRNRLAADATHTNIVMQLLRQTHLGVLSAYVQGNFTGAGYGFKLKQAYFRLHNVTVGLTRSTFVDALSGGPTIDYEGPCGGISGKNVLAQYKWANKDFTLALSAEIPQASYTTMPGRNEAIAQRCPDIPAYVQYQWDGGQSHVRASVIWRELSYRNLLTAENKFRTGWGVQLSGAVQATPLATVFYQVAYGKGISRYVNDLSSGAAGSNSDLISDGEGGGMHAPGSLDIAGGLQINITPKLFVSASYSLCRLYDQESMDPDFYRRGNYAVVNAFYTPISDLQFGIEYLNGRRTNMDRQHGTANRIEACVRYDF